MLRALLVALALASASAGLIQGPDLRLPLSGGRVFRPTHSSLLAASATNVRSGDVLAATAKASECDNGPMIGNLVKVAAGAWMLLPNMPPHVGKQADAAVGKIKEAAANCKPPAVLANAYRACGIATTAAWGKIVLETIASNAPKGMMMPSYQHGLFARMGSFAAVPLIYSAVSTLASASNESWEKLGSPTCRRLNLALATAGLGSAVWVNFAPLITQIPGTTPLVAHAGWLVPGPTKVALMAAYSATAALSAGVFARSLPEDVRKNPLSIPGRVADGVAKSVLSILPKDINNPVNVKYSLLTASFIVFTGLQLGSHPLSVVPSWTGRRCARHFGAWTLLAAAQSFDLKEACEKGKLLTDPYARKLSNGIKAFGSVYLAATFGKVFLDPSFPAAYHAVVMVPAWSAFAVALISYTLRPDAVPAVKK